jgi:hypothetical protein
VPHKDARVDRDANDRKGEQRQRGSRGGAVPQTAPVAWVFLDRHRHGGYTIRWRRGDAVAYVLSGQQVGSHGMAEVLDTISVSPSGWTDLAEVRQAGQQWLRRR